MYKPIIIIVILATILFAGCAEAQMTISATGNWSPSIGEADLQSGAGSDLISTYESNSDQVSITIGGASGKSWRVDVKRTNVVWNDDLTLSIQRTGAGSGSGSILGGTTYQLIETSDSEFFSGTEDRSGIPAQLKLGGVSLQVPPNTYSTTVTYTLVEI